ncbi:alpha/beta fold hydrolase [Actinophytocola xanthii]|uniref:AB hydrolase-1 domain-containing protein n=1 Tax=Actinophytocola xanthii TaxID=1912961 RepID=A0A1Q8CJT8_9PSEU|nr:alpha/beta fold hydrolase [Actinophytocola xanthii]OLF14617.1 hypothetical protein BU204_26075 [Actinophytocola xanthii]
MTPHPTRRARRCLAAAAVVTASVITPAAATPGPAVSWQPCADNPRIDCASVPAPVDWSRPDGETISVAVARRAATEPSQRRGVLVYLPAGPGSSGVDAVVDDQWFGLLFPPEIAARFDVVGFDPRGVQRTSPVRCDAAVVAELDRPAPRSRREFDELLEAQAAVGTDCRARTGPVFDHLDSTQSAHDVDAIRAALEVDTVDLYGLSYGTVIGQRYAELFGSRLRTLTLDAVYDHGASPDRFDVTAALAAQESFDRFLTWCADTPSCELHGRVVRRIVADLFAAADEGSLVDPAEPDRPLDPTALTDRLVSPLTRPDLPDVAHRIAVLAGLAAAPAAADAPPASGEAALPIFTVCADTRVDATSWEHQVALARA